MSEELHKMLKEDLEAKAEGLGIDYEGMLKQDLVDAIAAELDIDPPVEGLSTDPPIEAMSAKKVVVRDKSITEQIADINDDEGLSPDEKTEAKRKARIALRKKKPIAYPRCVDDEHGILLQSSTGISTGG